MLHPRTERYEKEKARIGNQVIPIEEEPESQYRGAPTTGIPRALTEVKESMENAFEGITHGFRKSSGNIPVPPELINPSTGAGPVASSGASIRPSMRRSSMGQAWAAQAAELARERNVKEATDENRRCVLMVAPNSSKRMAWDTVSAVWLLYIAIVLPYRMGFEDDPRNGWYVFEFGIDMYVAQQYEHAIIL